MVICTDTKVDKLIGQLSKTKIETAQIVNIRNKSRSITTAPMNIKKVIKVNPSMPTNLIT